MVGNEGKGEEKEDQGEASGNPNGARVKMNFYPISSCNPIFGGFNQCRHQVEKYVCVLGIFTTS